MGHWGQGRMGAHQAKKLEDDALLAFRDRFALPLSDDDVATLRFYKPADDSPEMTLPARAPRRRSAATCRRARRRRRRCRCRRSTSFARILEGSKRARGVDDDGLRAAALAAAADAEHRQAHRADRRRRGAHLRHAVALPAGRDLLVGRASSTSRRTTTSCSTTRRRSDGQILEEGITEAGAMSSWIAAATSLQRARRADAAVLHLLFDVRLPARRRFHLGGGRLARARLPARRDRRPHDALGRRPAAPGRLEPPRRGDDPELPRLRPVLRLRARGDRAATACGGCWKRRRTSSTTSR